MKVSLISPNELDTALLACWRRIRCENPELASPFYAPEFTLAVGAVRNDLSIAVIEAGQNNIAFFPFHRLSLGRGRPVGYTLSDYHGLIAKPSFVIKLPELMKACGLYYFPFDHMPQSQLAFAPYAIGMGRSPVMDIRGGIDAYHARLAQQQGVGTAGVVRDVGVRLRRMERGLGPIRFEPNSRDHAVFEELFRWKSAQCLSKWKARADPFAVGWIRDCLERVFAAQEREFSGILSALYAGDSLVAAHFGIQSGSVCHWWFPSYDSAFAYFSPGLALLHSLARAGSAMGVDLIDLGRGDHDYKLRFMTDAISLMEGFVCRPTGLQRLVIPSRELRKWVIGHMR